MRLLSFITTLFITVPLTLFALSFALSNSLPVGVALWPLSLAATPAVSLGILGVVLLGGGFLMGAVFVGLWSQHWRFRAWQFRRRAERAERALADLELTQQQHRDAIAGDRAGARDDLPVLRLSVDADKKTGVYQPGTQGALRDVESNPLRFY